LQVYLAEKKEETGIRLNTDMPSLGKELSAVVNIRGEKQNLIYNLISLPVYMAENLKKIAGKVL
jgi:hypothetical protein